MRDHAPNASPVPCSVVTIVQGTGSTPERAVATDGRPLGERGARTRRRLLEATEGLLAERGVRDLTVADIARAVDTSPGTFYQYFHTVEDAVLALAEEAGEQLAPISAFLEEPLSGPDGLERAHATVEAFLAFWDTHRAVLRTRNLAAQEGDQRFRDVRNRSLEPITLALAAQVEAAQAVGAVDASVTPYAAAAALVAMIERMAAFHRDLEPRGVSRDALIATTARILHQSVTKLG